MGEILKQLQVIVLAAGHGKRMNNGELPKVLIPFLGKALITHILDAIKESGVCPKPLIVVGQKANDIKTVFGSDYTYVFQAEQLGTGHAVASTRPILEGRVKDIMVLYGDHPLITAQMIHRLADTHFKSGKVLTMAAVVVPDFTDWRLIFYDFSRVIRDEQSRVAEIIEKKDATEEQLKNREVNPSYFCFKAGWLWQNLDKLTNHNAQREYYLTDLVKIAVKQGYEIATIEIEPKEALGVNTVEQLELIKSLK